jgi:hypothetical protein
LAAVPAGLPARVRWRLFEIQNQSRVDAEEVARGERDDQGADTDAAAPHRFAAAVLDVPTFALIVQAHDSSLRYVARAASSTKRCNKIKFSCIIRALFSSTGPQRSVFYKKGAYGYFVLDGRCDGGGRVDLRLHQRLS